MGVAAGVTLGLTGGVTVSTLVYVLCNPERRARRKRLDRIMTTRPDTVGPWSWPWSKGSAQRKITGQLEGALILMASLIRAGVGPAEALATVCGEVASPLREHLQMVRDGYDAGRSLEDSLVAEADRTRVPELHHLALAIGICQTTGADIADLIDTLTERIREDRELERELSHRTSELTLTARILTVMPWLLFGLTVVTGPDTTGDALSNPSARMIMVLSCVAWLAGVLSVRRITDAKRLIRGDIG